MEKKRCTVYSYQEIIDIFSGYGAQLLTTLDKYDIAQIPKSKIKYHAIMQCGHEKTTAIRYLKKHHLCSKCTLQQISDKKKITGQADGQSAYVLLNKQSFDYIQNLISNELFVEKTNNLKSDRSFIFKPLYITENEWVSVSIRNCKSKDKNGSYNFTVKSRDIITIFICRQDEKIWIIEHEHLQNIKQTGFSDNKNTKYAKYRCDAHDVIKKLLDLYKNTDKKIGFTPKIKPIIEIVDTYIYDSAKKEEKAYKELMKLLIYRRDYKEKAQGYGEIYRMVFPKGKSYIGQTVLYLLGGRRFGSVNRFKSHVSESKKENGKGSRLLNHAIRKYGKDNIALIVLATVKINKLTEYEDYFMKMYETMTPTGYNLKEAGHSGRPSEETRQKMREKRNPNLGKSPSEATRQKIRETNIDNATRYGHDKELLPKYIKHINHKDREGYGVISHPLCKEKTWVSTKKSLEEKKELAIRFLAELDYKLSKKE
jgi:hypothetical protein